MRFLFSIAFLLFASLPLSHADTNELSYIAPLAPKSALMDIAVDGVAVVVGERGHVLIANNTGEFKQVQVPTQATLTSSAVVGNSIWAAGHDAVIIHSSDSGKTWEVQHVAPELERPILDMLFFDNRHGIAIGGYGLFYRTTDGGETWTTERHAELLDPMDQEYLEEIRVESEEFYIQELDSILPHLNSVSYDGSEVLLAGEAGLLATSSDFGKTWTRLSIDYYGSFFSFAKVNLPEDNYLAVGLRGNAFYSSNAKSWQRLETCTSATLNAIYQVSDNRTLLVGNNGALVFIDSPSENTFNANSKSCDSMVGIQTTQTEDKTAILDVGFVDNKHLAVTANGLKSLDVQ